MCQGCVGNIFGSLGRMRSGVSRRKFLAAAAAAASIAPLAGRSFAASTDGADLIFRGGPIIPMTGDSRLSAGRADVHLEELLRAEHPELTERTGVQLKGRTEAVRVYAPDTQ